MFTNYCRNNTKKKKTVKILNEEKPKCVHLYKRSSLTRNGDKAEDPVWFHC